MVIIYVQSTQNRNYENSDRVLLSDLRSIYNDNNGNRKLLANFMPVLENLKRINLVAFVEGRDGKEAVIKITPAGIRVGGILYERERETNGLIRKEESAK